MTFGVRSWGSGPGIEAEVQASERLIQHNIEMPEAMLILKRVTVVSTAVDSGNTPTTTLRAGLPMAKITSTGKYTAWDINGDAVDGSQNAIGFIFKDQDMLSHVQVAEDKTGVLLAVGGVVKASMITTLNQLLRNQLSGRFIFDDDLEQSFQQGPFAGMRLEIVTGTSKTIPAGESGIFYVTTNAAVTTITLPALAAGGGMEFAFFNVGANGLIVAANAADVEKMICFNEADADALKFVTAGNMIGAAAIVKSIDIGGAFKWLGIGLGANTMTSTE